LHTFFLAKKDNLAKKNARQCFSNESEGTCKNSADLEEKKTPKKLLSNQLIQALLILFIFFRFLFIVEITFFLLGTGWTSFVSGR